MTRLKCLWEQRVSAKIIGADHNVCRRFAVVTQNFKFLIRLNVYVCIKTNAQIIKYCHEIISVIWSSFGRTFRASVNNFFSLDDLVCSFAQALTVDIYVSLNRSECCLSVRLFLPLPLPLPLSLSCSKSTNYAGQIHRLRLSGAVRVGSHYRHRI